MKFTIREIAEHFKVSLSTLKNWNTERRRTMVQLAQLEIFIEQARFTKEDLEFLKSLLKRETSYELKKKAKSFEERYKKYFDKSKNYELAVELFALGFEKEELELIYSLKTGGIKK